MSTICDICNAGDSFRRAATRSTSSTGFPTAGSASAAPNRFEQARDACVIGFILVVVVGATLARGQELDLPVERILGDKAGDMMSRYWRGEAEKATERWRAEYEARTAPEQIATYQAQLREEFLKAVGGLPERTPLKARVTGTIRREGYRVEKIIFESQPKHFVTALLFVPEANQFTPPYPGVLVPCGHARSAKAHDEYQSAGALFAIHGMVALVFDPIDQGERGQYLGEDGWPGLWGTRAHSLLGIGATLLGRNTARFEIWDGMRAIDYLQSRPEVDPQRIGCTGNSGGGTQTSYLMALDDRIRAAAPSCYLCGFPALLRTIGPQDAEQNIYENRLAPRRAARWETGDRNQLLTEVRRLAGIRRLEDLPRPEVETFDAVQRPGYRVEKLLLKPEKGIVLSALRFVPEMPKPGLAVLYVHQQGKAADALPGGPIEALVQHGSVVLAVDLRGTGQTHPTGSEGKDVYTAYLLGRSYVGLRAEDILISARHLTEHVPTDSADGIQLVAVGHVGIPALHAAATEPGLFESVKLDRSLESWSTVIHGRLTDVQATQIVHGALQTYDLPDLAVTLEDRLTVEQPFHRAGAEHDP